MYLCLMRELKLWKFVVERLQVSEPVMLMCVVESSGSSPGRRGFKMAVTKDNLSGSIGGGIMEHKFVELAKGKLLEDSEDSLLRKQFHQKTAAKDQSGMICSGEQTILLSRINKKDLPCMQSLVASLEKNKNGELRIDSTGIGFSEDASPDFDFSFEKESENSFRYTERTGYRNHLTIVGGGHCALALSKLVCGMDFYTRVYEERKDLNTLEENNFANEKIILEDYSELSSLIYQGENHYVAVMTFGYRTDDRTVRAIIDKNFDYLGVLGSESKMKQLFEEWRADGLPEGKLQKIYSPIGIRIKSETPEEIAVSIAAEIIKVKNRSPVPGTRILA